MTEDDKSVIDYRLERARDSLAEAHLLAQSDYWNAAVNRLYYACFYAVSALLLSEGHTSSKHSGVRSLFNQYFVKTNRLPKDAAAIYNSLFDLRLEGDYEDLVRIPPEKVEPWFDEVRAFIQTVSSLLKGKPPQHG